MSKEKELPNVEALVEFRLKGEVVKKGAVVSKKSFAQKADWQNLVHMEPARCKETDAKVRAEAPKGKGKLPGADEKKTEE